MTLQRAKAKRQGSDHIRLMDKIKQAAVGNICVVATKDTQPKFLDGTLKNTVVGDVGIVLSVGLHRPMLYGARCVKTHGRLWTTGEI